VVAWPIAAPVRRIGVLMRSAADSAPTRLRHSRPWGRINSFKGTRAGSRLLKQKHAAMFLPREVRMFAGIWRMLKETVLAFIEDEALSRGAAIAFYTVTSIAPVLLIVIAIAGLAFGQDAAQNAITAQLSGLMGQQTAEVLQTAVASAASKSSGIVATIIGITTLVITASGVFGEMQTALNAIWKAKPIGTTVSRLIRARAASLGLVAALGFLLMVSLVVSTALTAFGNYLDSVLPFGKLILTVLNVVVSLMLISFLFAAIYKVLPDRSLEWGDVVVGAVVTAVLFTVGKSLISWYIGSSAVASSFGAAGALIVLLLWVYYSAQIFLLGAEFTKAYANRRGSKQGDPVSETETRGV
jgi:membrane protein